MTARRTTGRAARPHLNWAAVADAVAQRMDAHGWTMVELSKRSRISISILREIRDHSVERRRTRRILTTLSVALGWDPDHLTTILLGQPPPTPIRIRAVPATGPCRRGHHRRPVDRH